MEIFLVFFKTIHENPVYEATFSSRSAAVDFIDLQPWPSDRYSIWADFLQDN